MDRMDRMGGAWQDVMNGRGWLGQTEWRGKERIV